MKYNLKSTIWIDRNPNGSYEQECDPYMVADKPVLEWRADESSYGEHAYSLRPAFNQELGRCWLLGWDWFPARGYCAEGGGTKLIPFNEGVKLLVEHEVFAFPVPEEAPVLIYQ